MIPNVTVGGTVSGLDATLMNADLNNDNTIDIGDFGVLVSGFGLSGAP